MLITVSRRPCSRHGSADVMLAVAEDDLTIPVERGENAGRTLTHGSVVRSLTTLGRLQAATSTLMVSTDVPLMAGWRAPTLRAIAFAQERDTRRILGVVRGSLVNSFSRLDGARRRGKRFYEHIGGANARQISFTSEVWTWRSLVTFYTCS